MPRLRPGFALAAATLVVLPISALVNPDTLKRNPLILEEIDFKEPRPPGLPRPVTARVERNSLSYNGSTVEGPLWDRPIECGPNISGLGPVRYHVQPFTVTANGTYSVTSAQTFDGYIQVYASEFDPAPTRQTLNCVAGNDDGADGVGTSEVLALPLAAGTQYFAVTSGFRASEKGTFTNTISGTGFVALGSGGPDVSLTMTPSITTAVPGETFVYDVTVTNFGPGTANTIALELETSANQTVVSNTCGQDPIATLAEGASFSCELTVTLEGCGSAVLSGSVDAEGIDDPINNLDTARVNLSLVADESFEAGSPSPTWAEASTRFGTPLCTLGTCGSGTGSLPKTGNWWAWFGGVAGFEEGRLSQSVLIPDGGTVVLEFSIEQAVCSGTEADFLEILVDGEPVYRTDATSHWCGSLGYRPQSIDLSDFADGESHLLEFHSVLDSGENTNFFIHDVTIASCTRGVTGGTGPPTIPTLHDFGLAALALLLGVGAIGVLRRRGGA